MKIVLLLPALSAIAFMIGCILYFLNTLRGNHGPALYSWVIGLVTVLFLNAEYAAAFSSPAFGHGVWVITLVFMVLVVMLGSVIWRPPPREEAASRPTERYWDGISFILAMIALLIAKGARLGAVQDLFMMITVLLAWIPAYVSLGERTRHENRSSWICLSLAALLLFPHLWLMGNAGSRIFALFLAYAGIATVRKTHPRYEKRKEI